MLRLSRLIGTAVVLVGLTATAHAADYMDSFDGLRGSYGEDWSSETPLEFEMGVRYWYSLGAQSMSVSGGNYAAQDTSHIIEGHLRIDDNSTATYLKGQAGYAVVIDGTYQTPGSGGSRNMAGGEIGYAGADFGYLPFGNDSFKLGGFVGYQYLTDNPDMGRQSYLTSGGGYDSDTNSFDINALRLGGAAHIELGDMFDINAEAAVIPYANLYGRYGAFYQAPFLSGGNLYEQGSYGTIAGRMYGAAGEVMLGFHPTENLTLRVGGRAYYMTGDATMNFTARRSVGNGSQDYVGNISNLEILRYGALAEITGSF